MWKWSKNKNLGDNSEELISFKDKIIPTKFLRNTSRQMYTILHFYGEQKKVVFVVQGYIYVSHELT